MFALRGLVLINSSYLFFLCTAAATPNQLANDQCHMHESPLIRGPLFIGCRLHWKLSPFASSRLDGEVDGDDDDDDVIDAGATSLVVQLIYMHIHTQACVCWRFIKLIAECACLTAISQSFWQKARKCRGRLTGLQHSGCRRCTSESGTLLLKLTPCICSAPPDTHHLPSPSQVALAFVAVLIAARSFSPQLPPLWPPSVCFYFSICA